MKTKCSGCGEIHDIENMDVVFEYPHEMSKMSDGMKKKRCAYTSDICVIDESKYLVRGVVHMNVLEGNRYWGIGAWAQVSQKDFLRYKELWSDDQQGLEPPFKAEFANAMPVDDYPSTLGMSCEVQLTDADSRPKIILTDMSHELAREQRDGISTAKVYHLLHLFMEGFRDA